MTFLVADCVAKSFGERRVLSSATLRAERGQVSALLGRNGSGKSTLVKIAVGEIAPDSGVIRLDGVAHVRMSLAFAATRGVFYLPDHELLSPAIPIAAQLAIVEQRFGTTRAHTAIALLGIGHVLDQFPDQLSGGELRRAELAFALTRGPACLVADEPYRGIAPADHDVLTRALRHLASEGCAVVVTGHEVPSLLAACDRVTWCTSGTTYELGPPELARQHEEFRRGYLGPKGY